MADNGYVDSAELGQQQSNYGRSRRGYGSEEAAGGLPLFTVAKRRPQGFGLEDVS
ncbi:MAG: hypothetical protein IKD59_07650 [Lachnospiraceae bacterium]|nr:hypothetical protein [Lachnospiraceae bacterium]